MRILVVDDQKTTGMALCQVLVALGHEPRLVGGGAAAWDVLAREDWRLILTDWMMPDVDGLELCRRIRAREGGPYRYVIMLTARGTRSDRIEGLSAGADDFLTKPVDEQELIVRLAVARRILAVQAELEEKTAGLADLADTDPLTGLANRRRLEGMVDGMLSAPDGLLPYSVASLDLDHFKSYNDRYGHGAGDVVLRIVAGLLRAGTRTGDLVVRTGGEEFVVVLPRTGPEEALAIAERLRRAIAEYPWPLRLVTASLGVTSVCSPVSARDHGAALEAADRALYHSKRAGRDRVTQAAPPGREPLDAMSGLVSDAVPRFVGVESPAV